ncbi:hypothetical protein CEXT_535481, partial [Caerostris extrusa]
MTCQRCGSGMAESAGADVPDVQAIAIHSGVFPNSGCHRPLRSCVLLSGLRSDQGDGRSDSQEPASVSATCQLKVEIRIDGLPDTASVRGVSSFVCTLFRGPVFRSKACQLLASTPSCTVRIASHLEVTFVARPASRLGKSLLQRTNSGICFPCAFPTLRTVGVKSLYSNKLS